MLNIVLHEPLIIDNLGNIIRTCVGFNATLHLIKPYGFILNWNDPRLKRTCTNHLKKVKIIEYLDYADFVKKHKNDRIYYLTKLGTLSPNQTKCKKQNIYFMFGKETSGLGKKIINNNKKMIVRIPATKDLISFNVANCVSIMCYEYYRQNNFIL